MPKARSHLIRERANFFEKMQSHAVTPEGKESELLLSTSFSWALSTQTSTVKTEKNMIYQLRVTLNTIKVNEGDDKHNHYHYFIINLFHPIHPSI